MPKTTEPMSRLAEMSLILRKPKNGQRQAVAGSYLHMRQGVRKHLISRGILSLTSAQGFGKRTSLGSSGTKAERGVGHYGASWSRYAETLCSGNVRKGTHSFFLGAAGRWS